MSLPCLRSKPWRVRVPRAVFAFQFKFHAEALRCPEFCAMAKAVTMARFPSNRLGNLCLTLREWTVLLDRLDRHWGPGTRDHIMVINGYSLWLVIVYNYLLRCNDYSVMSHGDVYGSSGWSRFGSELLRRVAENSQPRPRSGKVATLAHPHTPHISSPAFTRDP